MEYVAMRGEFDDVPRDMLLQVFAEYYPRLLPGHAAAPTGLAAPDWDEDVATEAGLPLRNAAAAPDTALHPGKHRTR